MKTLLIFIINFLLFSSAFTQITLYTEDFEDEIGDAKYQYIDSLSSYYKELNNGWMVFSDDLYGTGEVDSLFNFNQINEGYSGLHSARGMTSLSGKGNLWLYKKFSVEANVPINVSVYCRSFKEHNGSSTGPRLYVFNGIKEFPDQRSKDLLDWNYINWDQAYMSPWTKLDVTVIPDTAYITVSFKLNDGWGGYKVNGDFDLLNIVYEPSDENPFIVESFEADLGEAEYTFIDSLSSYYKKLNNGWMVYADDYYGGSQVDMDFDFIQLEYGYDGSHSVKGITSSSGVGNIWLYKTFEIERDSLLNVSVFGRTIKEHNGSPTGPRLYVFDGIQQVPSQDSPDLLSWDYLNSNLNVISPWHKLSASVLQSSNHITVALKVNDGWNGYPVSSEFDYLTISKSAIDGKPEIIAVNDVPTDQGGFVTVNFERSPYDTGSLIEKTLVPELYTVELNDGAGWIASATSGAYGKSFYSVLVPTIKDSNAHNNGILHFRVIAHMAEGNYASDQFTGYSVDNLFPAIPAAPKVELDESGILLSWNENNESDFDHYTIYRSTDNQQFSKIDVSITNSYLDSSIDQINTYYYVITSSDYNGNESHFSESSSMSITDIGDESAIPHEYYIKQNLPNPFNPETAIPFGIKQQGHVRIVIFDAVGRKVYTLLDIELNAGHYKVVWDGRDTNNNTVSTGIYFYQIYCNGFTANGKMQFIK